MKQTPTRDERPVLLEAWRQRKMARSAHAYVRGNTALFYRWLEQAPAARLLPEGPAIWICGDCHLGNLGPVADRRGRVEIEIRDLDQAVIGNPALDLIRLGLSLATAARGSDLPGVVTARMMEAMVAGYEAAMVEGPAAAAPEPDVVRSVRRRALGRRWRHLARERLEAVEPRIPLGKRFWRLEPDERHAVAGLFDEPSVADTVLSLHGHAAGGRVRLADAAYWMKGCSSLGLLRVAALAELPSRHGAAHHALIDLKEAVAPIAPPARGAAMPADPARRVVAAARALSPYLGKRMAAGRVLGRSMFERELKAQDMKLEVEQFASGEAVRVARHLAFVVGRAHARQLAADDRRAWAAELAVARAGGLEAPSWLWEAVVALASRHEGGYLEHCRGYALAA